MGREDVPLISFSSSVLDVALSMTSSRTDGPSDGPDVSGRSSVLTSVTLVCCKIEILVSSGIPGMSFSAMALRSAHHGNSQHPFSERAHLEDILDFPVPFLPTRAYRPPALSLNLALLRISVPSDALALPFPLPEPLSAGPDVTVILRPSTSS